MIYVRTTVTGPVTTATMKVEDQDTVTVEGTGEFTGNQVVLLGGPYDTGGRARRRALRLGHRDRGGPQQGRARR